MVDADLQGALQIVVRPGVRLLQADLDFLEKIAEGFVIEAYNSTKEKGYNSKPKEKQMKLDAYDLPMLERAIDEMRGKALPSDGARAGFTSPQTGGAKGGSTNKRKIEVSWARASTDPRTTLRADDVPGCAQINLEDDGRIPADQLCWAGRGACTARTSTAPLPPRIRPKSAAKTARGSRRREPSPPTSASTQSAGVASMRGAGRWCTA